MRGLATPFSQLSRVGGVGCYLFSPLQGPGSEQVLQGRQIAVDHPLSMCVIMLTLHMKPETFTKITFDFMFEIKLVILNYLLF